MPPLAGRSLAAGTSGCGAIPAGPIANRPIAGRPATSSATGSTAFTGTAFTGTAIGLGGRGDQIPTRSMQARIEVAADFAEDISVDVLDLDRHLFRFLGDRVEQARSRRRILADVSTVGRPACCFAPPSNRGGRLVKERCLGHVCCSKLMQWRDVCDPKAPAVRGRNDFAVIGMKCEIEHRHRWQIGVEFVPVFTAIGGGVDCELGADQQDVFVERAFAKASGRSPRQVGTNRFPRFAVVFGDKNIGVVIVRSMAIQTEIDPTVGKPRGFDRRHPAGGGEIEVLSDLDPFLTPIAGHPQSTVIGTRIQHVGVARRFGEGRRRTSFGQRDFRRDLLEIATAIERSEHVISRCIEDAGVGIRKNKRRVPIEAVGGLALPGLSPDRCALAGLHVTPTHVAVLARPIDEIRIIRVDAAHESIAAADAEPVFVNGTAAAERQGRTTPGSVVLQTAVDVVRIFGCNRDVIELAQGQRVEMVPAIAAIVGGVDASIDTDDHVSAVARIDPQRVSIGVHPASERGFEGQSAIARFELRNAEQIDLLFVARVDANDAEVHRTGVEAVDANPAFTAIGRLIDPAIFVSLDALLILDVLSLAAQGSCVRSRRKRSVFHDHVDFFHFRCTSDLQADFVPCLQVSEDRKSTAVIGDRLALDLLDDIPLHRACFRRRSILGDLGKRCAAASCILARDSDVRGALLRRRAASSTAGGTFLHHHLKLLGFAGADQFDFDFVSRALAVGFAGDLFP